MRDFKNAEPIPAEGGWEWLTQVMRELFRFTQEAELVPPYLIEATDADDDCIVSMVFDVGSDGRLFPTSDSTPPEAEHRLAVFPVKVVVTDANHKQAQMLISAPEFKGEGGVH